MTTPEHPPAWGAPPASPAGPAYGPPGYGPPPGWGAPGYGPPPGAFFPRPTNTLAVMSLVLAFVAAPAGIVCGIVARRQIARTGEEGAGLALAGIVLGSVFTAFWVLGFVLWLGFFVLATSGSFAP
jgi:Domain of unknown function (DUF4190)